MVRSQVWETTDPKAEHDYASSPYAAMYGNPISYSDPYGDCPNCAAAGIGALIGGFGNLIYQGLQGNIHGWGDAGKAFGIGAVAGAAAGFTGGATLTAMGGTGAVTSFGAAVKTGIAVGGVGGATSGAIEGAGNAWAFQDASAGEIIGAGIRGGVIGGFTGALTGGIAGGAAWKMHPHPTVGNLETGVGAGTGSGGGKQTALEKLAYDVSVKTGNQTAILDGRLLIYNNGKYVPYMPSSGNMHAVIGGLLRTGNGGLIGNQIGRNPMIRTVTPSQGSELLGQFRSLGGSPVNRAGYPGQWYDLPGGGGYGVRGVQSGASTRLGTARTIDLNIPGAPIKKIKF